MVEFIRPFSSCSGWASQKTGSRGAGFCSLVVGSPFTKRLAEQLARVSSTLDRQSTRGKGSATGLHGLSSTNFSWTSFVWREASRGRDPQKSSTKSRKFWRPDRPNHHVWRSVPKATICPTPYKYLSPNFRYGTQDGLKVSCTDLTKVYVRLWDNPNTPISPPFAVVCCRQNTITTEVRYTTS